MIDSQSVKTKEKGGCGYDARKKIKDRKRHSAVDTQGALLQAYVTSGRISDKKGGKKMLRSKRLRTIRKIWVDAGYQRKEFCEIAGKRDKEVEVIKRPPGRIRVYNAAWRAEWIPKREHLQSCLDVGSWKEPLLG